MHGPLLQTLVLVTRIQQEETKKRWTRVRNPKNQNGWADLLYAKTFFMFRYCMDSTKFWKWEIGCTYHTTRQEWLLQILKYNLFEVKLDGLSRHFPTQSSPEKHHSSDNFMRTSLTIATAPWILKESTLRGSTRLYLMLNSIWNFNSWSPPGCQPCAHFTRPWRMNQMQTFLRVARRPMRTHVTNASFSNGKEFLHW